MKSCVTLSFKGLNIKGTCVEPKMVELGFSKPCAACFRLQTDCIVKNCKAECINPKTENKEDCNACVMEHCADDFEDCTGFELTDF